MTIRKILTGFPIMLLFDKERTKRGVKRVKPKAWFIFMSSFLALPGAQEVDLFVFLPSYGCLLIVFWSYSSLSSLLLSGFSFTSLISAHNSSNRLSTNNFEITASGLITSHSNHGPGLNTKFGQPHTSTPLTTKFFLGSN